MTKLLQQAFERASELPQEDQGKFARSPPGRAEIGAAMGGIVQPSRI